MRVLLVAFLLLTAACTDVGAAFIPGSAQLPDCVDPPAVDLNGTEWFDTGTVTIQTAGCMDADPLDVFSACPLNWDFVASGNDVTITVDDEYRVEGRICGDQLSLRGGWWLPVEDNGSCTYDDDSAEEVRIESGGSVLAVTSQQMTGTLSVRGSCQADYAVTFARTSGSARLRQSP